MYFFVFFNTKRYNHRIVAFICLVDCCVFNSSDTGSKLCWIPIKPAVCISTRSLCRSSRPGYRDITFLRVVVVVAAAAVVAVVNFVWCGGARLVLSCGPPLRSLFVVLLLARCCGGTRSSACSCSPTSTSTGSIIIPTTAS